MAAIAYSNRPSRPHFNRPSRRSLSSFPRKRESGGWQPSFPRKRESRGCLPRLRRYRAVPFWIPAYAGMTVGDTEMTVGEVGDTGMTVGERIG